MLDEKLQRNASKSENNVLPSSKWVKNLHISASLNSGVARGVAGVAEATPIIQFLFNKFGQKIRVKRYRIYCGLHQFQNPTYLPADLN